MNQLLRILLVEIINDHTGEFLILHFVLKTHKARRYIWLFFLFALAAALIGFFELAIRILLRLLIIDFRIRSLLFDP